MRTPFVVLGFCSALLMIVSLSVIYRMRLQESLETLTERTMWTMPTINVTDTTTTPVPSWCPPNGVWSEWTTTGHCPTTCGACHVATRKRKCLKTCGDCPCVGPSKDVGPCGLALCQFPIRTCCIDFVKSLNYQTKSFFCGTENVQAVKCRSPRLN